MANSPYRSAFLISCRRRCRPMRSLQRTMMTMTMMTRQRRGHAGETAGQPRDRSRSWPSDLACVNLHTHVLTHKTLNAREDISGVWRVHNNRMVAEVIRHRFRTPSIRLCLLQFLVFHRRLRPRQCSIDLPLGRMWEPRGGPATLPTFLECTGIERLTRP